jgi:serine/threonine protein kinase
VLEVLGEGTYGVVYKAVDLTNERVSIFSILIDLGDNTDRGPKESED